MINYFHDIKNKLGVVLGSAYLLQERCGKDCKELNMIKRNAERIDSLINDAYLQYVGQLDIKIMPVHSSIFVTEFSGIIKSISERTSINIFQENFDFMIISDYSLYFSSNLLIQTLENGIDMSIKAKAKHVTIKAQDLDSEILIEIIDNGVDRCNQQKYSQNESILPSNFGKITMSQNIRQLSGRIEWPTHEKGAERVARMYLPKIYLSQADDLSV